MAASVGSTEFDLRRDGLHEALVVPGFLYVVLCTAAHGLNGPLDAAPPGHDDHRQRGIGRVKLREQIEALASRRGIARVVQVDQHAIRIEAFHGFKGGLWRPHAFGLEAGALEQQSQGLHDVRVIVSKQNPGDRSTHGSSLPFANPCRDHEDPAVVCASQLANAAAVASSAAAAT